MKRKLLLSLGLLFSAGLAKAQWTNNFTWDYNFGISNPTTTWSTVGTNSTSSATTAGFLPVTPSSSNAGVYLNANAASGSFTLNNDNTLIQKLPTTSFGRFSVNSVGTATDIVVNSFKIKFAAASASAEAGNYIYAIGNHKGNLFNITSNNSVFRSSAEIFTALRWTPATAANTSTITFAYREKSTDTDAGTQTYTTINTTTFVKGTEYTVDIYCNNSSLSTSYTVASMPYTLPKNTFHIWVNGAKLGADFPRSIEEDIDNTNVVTSVALANGAALNSFLFSANGTTAATGNITLTNPKLVYSVTTNPVSFTSFTGKKTNTGVALSWATASEQNNSYFEVLRSVDGKTFTSIGTVKGKGNTSETTHYLLTDNTPVVGVNYYQLKQFDKDGTSTAFKEIVPVDYTLAIERFTVSASERKLNLLAYAAVSEWAELNVFDLNGKKVLTSKQQLKVGENTFSIDTGNLPKGVLIIKLKGNVYNKTAKTIK